MHSATLTFGAKFVAKQNQHLSVMRTRITTRQEATAECSCQQTLYIVQRGGSGRLGRPCCLTLYNPLVSIQQSTLSAQVGLRMPRASATAGWQHVPTNNCGHKIYIKLDSDCPSASLLDCKRDFTSQLLLAHPAQERCE